MSPVSQILHEQMRRARSGRSILSPLGGFMSDISGAEETRAVLEAYKLVKDASWPEMHPRMSARAAQWAHLPEAQLRAELAEYVREASEPGCAARVFWKLGPDFAFAGCNLPFARDAGKESPSEVIGLTDFSEGMPWQGQAAKYRYDDKEVADSGKPKLDILERQASANGLVWVLVGKAPVRAASGRVLGVLGMYEQIEAARAQKLFAAKAKQDR
jgi:hypothetical protein